jgi:hypothetical protein
MKDELESLIEAGRIRKAGRRRRNPETGELEQTYEIVKGTDADERTREANTGLVGGGGSRGRRRGP